MIHFETARDFCGNSVEEDDFTKTCMQTRASERLSQILCASGLILALIQKLID